MGNKPSCETCGKMFSSDTNLKVHVKTHTKEYKYFCDFCGQGFVTHGHFEGHVNKHKKRLLMNVTSVIKSLHMYRVYAVTRLIAIKMEFHSTAICAKNYLNPREL